jgi:hypothetical protein
MDYSNSSAGALASAAWLSARAGRRSGERWRTQVLLDVVGWTAAPTCDETVATRFHLEITSDAWGLFFFHAGKVSRIRVTDAPFVQGRDDFGFLAHTPPLKDVRPFLHSLEHHHGIRFQREHAMIHSTLDDIEPAVRRWVLSL